MFAISLEGGCRSCRRCGRARGCWTSEGGPEGDLSSNFLHRLPAQPPALPPALRVLRAHSNEVARLPRLPAGLEELVVAFNPLTALPRLPAALRLLNAHQTRLPSRPAALQHNPNMQPHEV